MYKKCIILGFLISVGLRGAVLEHAIESGESLSGKNIRIKISKSFPEVPEFTNGDFQVGNGDCFQFMLYAEYLQNLGAHVVIDLPEMIRPYFSLTTKLVLSNTVDITNYQEVQLADLYEMLHDNVPNFNRSTPLFVVPDELILKWDKEIKKRTGDVLIPVVIFTNGAPHHSERFPAIDEWTILTSDMPHVLFINAQYKGEEVPQSVRARDFVDEFDYVTYLDTMALVYAAVVLNNGFVISPDTGSLHLCAAGLEGIKEAEHKVFGILGHCPDQRWRLGNRLKSIAEEDGVKINSNVWYPKSMLVFQQTEANNFIPVMQAIKNQIKKVHNQC